MIAYLDLLTKKINKLLINSYTVLEFKKYINEEIQKESISSPFKFIGGFGTNAINQGLRGVGNSILGSAGLVSGSIGAISNLASSGVYRILGNKKISKNKLKKSKENIYVAGKGLGNIVKAVAQLGGVATLITPTLRGFQAAAEAGVSGFNKNRNYTQKLLGLNSNEETPFVIKDLPKDIVSAKIFIEEFYEQANMGREIKISIKPEKFLKIFISMGSAVANKYRDGELNEKFKKLLRTYFPDFEVIELNVGTLLSKKNLYKDADVVSYIDYLYEKSLKDKVIIITNNDKVFFLELEKIYKSIPNNDDPDAIESELKNKIKQIIKKFIPSKNIN